MLLHKNTSEDSIRLFFQVRVIILPTFMQFLQDAYHMIVKILMNPFYERGNRIRDPVLERVLREVARQRLVPASTPY